MLAGLWVRQITRGPLIIYQSKTGISEKDVLKCALGNLGNSLRIFIKTHDNSLYVKRMTMYDVDKGYEFYLQKTHEEDYYRVPN